MPLQEMAKVISNRQVKPGYMLMELFAPRITAEAEPGQFVHVKVAMMGLDPLLRRPISLYGIDKNSGTLSLLYVVVGRGTKLLSEISAGTELDLMGPLGTGFWLPEDISRPLIIGGGIGVAPLFPLIEKVQAAGLHQNVLYGFRNAETVVGIDKIEAANIPLQLATDDGSAGAKGYVTELISEVLKDYNPDYFYTCGPEVMIKNVVKLMRSKGIEGQVSLEARMGCGVGACLACTCKTRVPLADSEKKEQAFDYSLVCTQGPVFDAGEVIFDE